MLPILTFEPIFKERIWGGRLLEQLYAKALPPAVPIGESWEISDRPGDESRVADGPCRGKSLQQLMQECPEALLGPLLPMPKRFPLLLKIIDARATLSLQVHPPARLAAQLGGEPKTEMWYVAHAGPQAELYVGLKKGVTRADFEQQLALGAVADCFHRIPVKAGDAMFLPSGRVHALGAEIVVFEIQQNSDTTYRVFDWNRLDAAGKPRQLHPAESLASIEFNDFEPPLLPAASSPGHPGVIRPLVKDPLFQVSVRRLPAGESLTFPGGRMRILAVVEGAIRASQSAQTLARKTGEFCLVPFECQPVTVQSTVEAAFLQIELG